MHLRTLHRQAIAAIGAALLLMSVSLAFTVPAAHAAANAGQPTRVTLKGHQIRALNGAHALHGHAGDAALHLSIGLNLRNTGALEQLLAAQSDPHSSLYHNYLKRGDYLKYFSPTQADVDTVTSFLRSQGLVVDSVSSDRLLISASGSTSSIERAFNIQVADYSFQGRTVYAPTSEPTVPSNVASVVTGITGFDDVAQISHAAALPGSGGAPSALTRNPSNAGNATANTGSGPAGGYTPSELRSAYDMNWLIGQANGAGQSVAIFELAGYNPSDVATYEHNYGLIPNSSSPNVVNTLVDGASMSPGSGSGEVELDMEVVSAIAPQAEQFVYMGPNSWQGLEDTYNRIVGDDSAPVISTSWGACEPYTPTSVLDTLHSIFQLAAAQGQTIFAASGDAGAYECGTTSLAVQSPSDDPYVVGVGGTSLTLNGDGSYNSETTWANPNNHSRGPEGLGSGGGVSTYFHMPSYQNGDGLYYSASNYREVPDVSADADPYTGYSIYCTVTTDNCPSNGWTVFGGTSAAAPLWAGVAADLNQFLPAHQSAPLGWANPILYHLANTAQPHVAYHDIADNSTNLYYPAISGYDEATGIGTPDVSNIALDLYQGTSSLMVSPTAITIALSPTDSLSGTRAVSVSNVGTGTLHWQVTSTLPAWLSLTATSGNVLEGATQSLTLSYNLSNNTQVYSASVVFSGDNGATTTLHVVIHPRATIVMTQTDGTDACTRNVLPPNDDGSTGAVPLGFTPDFFGQSYSTLYVNNNGNVTFDAPQSTYTPYPLQSTNRVIIAPFFADVWTIGGGQPVTYSYGGGTYQGHPAFCADWINVGYYYYGFDKLNSFQLVLIDRSDVGAGDFDIMMNYDQVQWETGDASGGTDGLGGSSARVGYSNGTTTSYEMPGSGVNGSFLDSNPNGLIYGSRGSLTPGRYIYQVRNGAAPTGGTITGGVYANSVAPANALAGSFVQACATNGFCQTTQTGANGQYTVSALSDGNYTVSALAPANTLYTEGSAGPLTISGGNTITGANIVLTGPQGLPPGTTITSVGTYGTGVPIVYWQATLTLTTTGCAGGTANYAVLLNGSTVRTGSMTESPSGTYTATIAPLYPNHGNAHITITIACPGGTTQTTGFDLYIDPSGTVQDQNGNPIPGAVVTLFRQDDTGNWVQVPDGSAILAPSNRHNPDATDSSGHYGWDVLAGTYKVRATEPGCTDPNNSANDYVESGALTVPPAITGLTLTLNCPSPDTTAPTITFAGQSFSGVSGAQVTLTDPSVSGQLTSGLKSIDVHGSNAQIVNCTTGALITPAGWSSATLPGSFQTLVTFSSGGTNTYTFCVDRVNPSSSASITVRATDQAGNVLDPRFKLKGSSKYLHVHASTRENHAVIADMD